MVLKEVEMGGLMMEVFEGGGPFGDGDVYRRVLAIVVAYCGRE